MTLLTSGKASSKLPPRATWRRRWCSRMPRGHSRPSTATLTLVQHVRWLLGHYVQARHQDAVPGACAKSGAPPLVDGDVDRFHTSNYTKNMAGADQLPLVVFPTIANVKLYHILIDGGAALNLISLAGFQKLQIPMSKLTPSRPFWWWARALSSRAVASLSRSHLERLRTTARRASFLAS
jgi:hypothetical protein